MKNFTQKDVDELLSFQHTEITQEHMKGNLLKKGPNSWINSYNSFEPTNIQSLRLEIEDFSNKLQIIHNGSNSNFLYNYEAPLLLSKLKEHFHLMKDNKEMINKIKPRRERKIIPKLDSFKDNLEYLISNLNLILFFNKSGYL